MTGHYIYPCDKLTPKDELRLLYSPMARKAVWVDDKTAKVLAEGRVVNDKLQKVIDELSDFIPLKERIEKVRGVEDYPLLTVLPNQKCNLSCSYCYSARGRSNTELSFEQLKTAIDFFIDSKGNNTKPLSISFMGGGEPMISWSLVKQGIVYAKAKGLEKNKKIDFTIITNGTIMSDEILEFILLHKINISISFEIIEEMQNKQRGAYHKVVSTLEKLIANGAIPQINSTITPDNVGRMIEMYEILERQFPEVSNMMFEPVTAAGLFETATALDIFLKRYADNFLTIDRMARKKNKSLTSFPYLRTVFPTERACAGEFCLTADGKLSGCYCISTQLDPGYSKSIYGEVSEEKEHNRHKITLQKNVFDTLLQDNVYTKRKCDECVAKWNCGGGCFYLRSCYSDEYQEVFCDFTRDFVQRVVLQRFERLYEKEHGISPKEDIRNIQLNYEILEVK